MEKAQEMTDRKKKGRNKAQDQSISIPETKSTPDVV